MVALVFRYCKKRRFMLVARLVCPVGVVSYLVLLDTPGWYCQFFSFSSAGSMVQSPIHSIAAYMRLPVRFCTVFWSCDFSQVTRLELALWGKGGLELWEQARKSGRWKR